MHAQWGWPALSWELSGGPGRRGTRDDMRQTCSTNRSLMWQVWVSPLPILYLLFHKVNLLCPFFNKSRACFATPTIQGVL